MAKTLIIIGISLVVLGLCWPLLQKLPLGRLPGDFVFKFGNFTFYFPLATSIIISIIISLVMYLFRK